MTLTDVAEISYTSLQREDHFDPWSSLCVCVWAYTVCVDIFFLCVTTMYVIFTRGQTQSTFQERLTQLLIMAAQYFAFMKPSSCIISILTCSSRMMIPPSTGCQGSLNGFLGKLCESYDVALTSMDFGPVS